MQPEVELSSTPNLLRKRSQQTACYPDGSTRDYVVGEPDLEKVIAMSHQYLPRYIYRVYSDASPGTNNKNGFSAHALLSSDRVKIEDMPQRQTRYIIDYHLRWLKHKRAWQSRLISVTSSLLFALQVAVHKRYKRIEHKKKAKRLNAKLQIARDKNHTSKIEDLQEEIRLHGQKPKDTNIFICILDTSTIPEDTAIYQANILAEAYENGDDIGLQKSYYIAELFVWESLQGDSSHVNFDELIKGGFLDLLSGYTESPNSLQLQVKRMRKELSSTRRTRHSVPADHFRMALAMAECFQAPFQLPMIIGFLSLASGRYTDGSVLAKITETIKEGKLHQSDFSSRFKRTPGCYADLPEVVYYEGLMDATYKDLRNWTNSNGQLTVNTFPTANGDHDMIRHPVSSNVEAPVDAAESFSHKRKEHAGSSINGSLRLENLGTRKRRLSDATDEEASSHANTKSDIRQEIKKLKMNVEENDLQKVTEGLQSSLSKTDKEIRENSSRAKTIDKQISAKDEEHGKRLECEQGNDEDESEATSSDRTSEESGNEGDSNDEAESDSDS